MGNVVPEVLHRHVLKVGFTHALQGSCAHEVGGEVLGVVVIWAPGLMRGSVLLVRVFVVVSIDRASLAGVLWEVRVLVVIVSPVVGLGGINSSKGNAEGSGEHEGSLGPRPATE